MPKSLVVYTVIVGGDYDLPPIWPQDGVDYICFTDQKNLEPNGWTIRHVSPLIPSDTFRSSREYKVRPHRWLANYSKSIYIDSTVHLQKSPVDLWSYLMPSEATLVGGFFHSFRETIADEFDVVAEERLDYQDTVSEQLQAYRTHHAKILNNRPIWGGVLARRHNEPACADVMEIWFSHILRYSRRDQLSLPLALAYLSHTQQNILLADIHQTEFHKWPVSDKPKPIGYRISEDAGRIQNTRKLASKRIRKFRRSLEKRHLLPSQWAGAPSFFWSSKTATGGNKNVSFGYDKDLKLYYAQDPNGKNRVFVSDRKRLTLYKRGIDHRLNWLLSDYRLPIDLIRKGDVVVDIGANIGELGLWVEDNGGQYIAFEPDPTAYRAMQNNIPGGDLYDVALSDSNGTAAFYLNTAEADSSLFKPSAIHDTLSVRTAMLDSFFDEVGMPSNIRLLKVEAEGMEPEVLTGARRTLGSVEYIAVDAGPERGGENTIPDVFNILLEAGFEVLDCFLLRGTFLLRRKRANRLNTLI